MLKTLLEKKFYFRLYVLYNGQSNFKFKKLIELETRIGQILGIER